MLKRYLKARWIIVLICALLLGLGSISPAATAPQGDPYFYLGLYGGGYHMSGWGWTPEGEVVIEVFDTPGGELIAGPIIVQTNSNGNFDATNVCFFIPGLFVRVTDSTSSIVKELTIQTIKILELNAEMNEVSGIAPPNAPISAAVGQDESWVEGFGLAESDGTWRIPFGGFYDIQPGDTANATYFDEDGEEVNIDLAGGQYLHLQGGYDDDWMEFYYYSPANTISYQVLDDQGTLLSSGETPTNVLGWGYINQNDHGVELHPGYQIVGYDQRRGITDTITLQNISTTEVDYDLDYVAGTAPPDIDLKVMVGIEDGGAGSIYHFDTHSDNYGFWSLYLMNEFGYDLTLETWVYAELSDEFGNTTFAALDEDIDEVINGIDNARLTFNPDQSDLDGDGVGDVEDPCPSDLGNTCNPQRSAAVSIDEVGGTLVTPQGDTLIVVPPGSLAGDTSISITDTGEGYLWEARSLAGFSGTTEQWAVFSNFIGPADISAALPITITLTWADADNDGLVDGLRLDEDDLVVLKNGSQYTDSCALDPGCNMEENQFTLTASSLGNFVLLGEKTFYWIYLPFTIIR